MMNIIVMTNYARMKCEIIFYYFNMVTVQLNVY